MKKTIYLLFVMTACPLLLLLAGCSHTPNWSDYVSEYRSQIFEGTEGEYSVFATFSRREYPYEADGNAGTMQDIFETTLTVPDNTKLYMIKYSVNNTPYQSELAFDSVNMTHSCSLSLPEPTQNEIIFQIFDAENTENELLCITATSVRAENTLLLDELLNRVSAEDDEKFTQLSSGKIFNGEIYVRLLNEDGLNYFYVGLIDRAGSIRSYLVDAQTGKILATR